VKTRFRTKTAEARAKVGDGFHRQTLQSTTAVDHYKRRMDNTYNATLARLASPKKENDGGHDGQRT